MKIILASDHGGVELKQKLESWIKLNEFSVTNFGCFNKDSCDYPLIGVNLASLILTGEQVIGVAICGTGIGMSIILNRFKGIRAALCTDDEMACLARAHNDANVLVLGGRITEVDKAIGILKAFLNTKCSKDDRHVRRRKQLDVLV